ncbi:MAG: bifunctional hydroxymethylpyrimidine kinase/phosphomethylpyrimidine kinase [Chloroflexota bacterium]|nr:bifunctional hydroxymethylpyrimidine kinase/phosphomethylpyrimidine kinase [Chloroflexota bacterium]MDE2895092.1 bifunctional hydroxymethylpyrimidine kinase/phosphomethylpyrimidine kinase [Chloroflexota bacterium]
MRVVCSIAGSDSSAGAGIQADLKSITANGAYAATVITAVTAQNTLGVQGAWPLPLDAVRQQIASVFEDLDVAGVKTGMLGGSDMIELVASEIQRRRSPFVVVDPVMISKTGFPLLAEDAASTLRRKLLPLATLITPNVHEAEALTGLSISTVDDAQQAGELLVEAGASAALVKGGHLKGAPATDVLVTTDSTQLFPGEWINHRHTHGTGCTYASAIAARLARGEVLHEAIGNAKEYVTEAIRGGLDIGHGVGPTDHFWMTRRD